MVIPQFSRFPLATGETVLIAHPAGSLIRTTHARLSITQTRDDEAVRLEPGGAFEIPGGGVLRVEASGQTLVSIEPPHARRVSSSARMRAAIVALGARR